MIMKRKTVQKLILSVGLFCTAFLVSANVASASVLTAMSSDTKCLAFYETEAPDYYEVYGYDQNGVELSGAEISSAFPSGYVGFAVGYQSDCADQVDFPSAGMYMAGGIGMQDFEPDPIPTSLTVKIRANGEIPEVILGTWYVTPSGWSLTNPESGSFANGVIASLYTTSKDVVEENIVNILLIGLAIFLLVLFYDYLIGIVEEKKKYKFVFGEFGAKSKDVEIRFSKDVYGNPIAEKKKKSATQTYMKTKEFKNWAKKNKIKY